MKLNANGIEIHYVLEGPEDAPTVTLSHSLATSLALWEPQAEALKSRYRVLRYDTRGHGQTDAPLGPYTFGLLADDVYVLLEALGIARTHFVGLSNGGMVGQSLALVHPEVLQRLVLCDTTSRPPPETIPIWEERARIVETQGMGPLVESTIERWFTAEFRTCNEALVDRFRDSIRNTPVAGYAGCCRAIQVFNTTERLTEIDLPTRIMVGEEDVGTHVFEHEIIHAGIKASDLVIFPETAHLSNLGAEKAFNAELLAFLDGQRRDRGGPA